MNQILVTGANGQLGSELRLLLPGANFTDVQELDITDREAVRSYVQSNNIKMLINCAAYTHVDRAEEDPQGADLLNHFAVENLASVCRECDAFLLHISTDYVFDGEGSRPYEEDAQTSPTGVYGVTKLAGEKSVKESGCRYIIIRTAWLYSEYGNNFVKTIRRLTAERDVVAVVSDQVGSPTYAADLAKAICKVISDPDKDRKQGIYHFSNEGVCSWYDFALAIKEMSGTTAKVIPCRSNEFPSKVKRPSFSVLDKGRIKDMFGVEVPYWRDSLLACILRMNGGN